MWNDISTLLSNISQDLLWNLVTPAEYNSAITYQHFLHFPRIEKVVDIVHRKYTWLKNQIFDFQVILGERIHFVCIPMWITWCFPCFHLWINLFHPSLCFFLFSIVSFRDCHFVKLINFESYCLCLCSTVYVFVHLSLSFFTCQSFLTCICLCLC